MSRTGPTPVLSVIRLREWGRDALVSARVRIAEGRDIAVELASLHQWPAREDALRVRVRIDQPPIGAEHMGALADTLVIAFGSGGAVAVLAQSVPVWLQQWHSDVTVEVTSRTGTTVSVTAQRVRDAQAVSASRPPIARSGRSGSARHSPSCWRPCCWPVSSPLRSCCDGTGGK
ncbi:hypothetical protein [Streptomyces sp. NBC_01471]|uniref:effector-associated constant component EACC1 n=1 Tax=Streptomyces sp. NBC_01471 TaxID=2903879 RepID=UPI00352D87D8